MLVPFEIWSVGINLVNSMNIFQPKYSYLRRGWPIVLNLSKRR